MSPVSGIDAGSFRKAAIVAVQAQHSTGQLSEYSWDLQWPAL